MKQYEARARPGQTILVHGANGGVGTTLVQLARYAGIRVIGTASPRHHDALRELGAEPIDYDDPQLADRVRALAPGGVQAVFDHLGGASFQRSFSLLARGGTLVAYGTATQLDDGNACKTAASWPGSSRPPTTACRSPRYCPPPRKAPDRAAAHAPRRAAATSSPPSPHSRAPNRAVQAVDRADPLRPGARSPSAAGAIILLDGDRRTIAQLSLLLRVRTQAQTLLRAPAHAGAHLEVRPGSLPLAVLAAPWRPRAVRRRGRRAHLQRRARLDRTRHPRRHELAHRREPATLLEVLDHLPGALYHWVVEQTMTALNDAAPASSDHAPRPTADHDPDEPLVLGEIHQLMLEVLRLAHASDALEAHLPVNPRSGQPADPTLRDRAWTRLAS